MQIISAIIYMIFLLAFVPNLLGRKPLTWYFSHKKYPRGIVHSKVFLQINRAISYGWAFAFLLALVLSQLEYSPYTSTNIVVSNAIAFFTQLLIGISLSIYLPHYYFGKKESKIKFSNLHDAFEAMPYGLNKHFTHCSV